MSSRGRLILTASLYIYNSPETATIEKAVPSVEFPVTQLLVRDEAHLVDISVKEGTTLKLWCSFDKRNTLAGIPKKRDRGT